MTQPKYQSLLAQRDALDKQLVAAMTAERIDVIAWILEQMAAYDIDVRDIYRRRVRISRPQSRAVAAKYVEPISGATWSGRGKTPRWLVGRDRKDFAL